MSALVLHDPVSLSVALTSPDVIPGDVLLLRGGYYTAQDLAISVNGTAEAPITIRPYDDEVPIIIPAGGSRGLFIAGVQHLVLDGLVIDGENVGLEGIKITNGAHNIRIQNCEVRNANTQGLLVTGDATDQIEIIGSKLHHNGQTDLHHGIYLGFGGAALVKQCQCYENVGHGIHVYGGLETGTTIVEQCFTRGNGVGVGVYYGMAVVKNNVCRDTAGILAGYGIVSGLLAFNTVLAETRDADLRATQLENAQVDFVNNVLAGSPESFVVHLEGTSGTSVTATNNLQIYATQIIGASGALEETGLVVAPFAPVSDNENEQIIPASGNPAFGAGVALDEITTDYGGNARANPPTIGAWE